MEDVSYELMLSSSHDYVKLTTYKLILYLSMVSSVYVNRMKIKWLVNDLEQHYLMEILAFETSEKSSWIVRFRLPQAVTNPKFFRDSNYFVRLRKEIN